VTNRSAAPSRIRRATLPVVFLLSLSVFATSFARDWRLPGLYMDAINPEYLAPGILHPGRAVEYILPGNKVFGDRFPVFTGTNYHGSVQLYAVLPIIRHEVRKRSALREVVDVALEGLESDESAPASRRKWLGDSSLSV
jgi:hypothetical protein